MRKTIAFALSLFGLFVSAYLLWVYASPSHPMVCLGDGCDTVRASQYAHLFGIPTPAYGVAFYALLAVLIFLETRMARPKMLRGAVLGLAAGGVAVSAALTYIEATVIHAWCAWCVAQAIAVTLIFLIWLSVFRSDEPPAAVRERIASRYVNVLLLAVIGASLSSYFLARAESRQAPPPPSAETIAAKVVRPDSHVTGNAQSPVMFVEFGDLQCPACGASYPIVKNLRKQYGDRVRFVFRHYPLPSIHAYAMHSAEAAECAGQQGKFWEYVDRAYEAKGDLKDKSLERYAGELGLDKNRFHECLANGATLPTVERDRQDGAALGVRGTPTFFVGQRRIEGPLTEYEFSTMLSEDLQKAGAVTPQAPAAKASETPQKTAKEEGNKMATPVTASTGGPGGGFFSVKGASTDCSEDAPKGPEAPLIHTADAQKRMAEGAVFVDVRSNDDFAKGHIKGARSIPLLEVERRVGELPKDKPIVVYEAGTAAGDVCAAAKSAARVLISQGYKVVVYQDGLKDWHKAGGAVEK